ncbi:hypothetical protein BAnh1_08490 [Bartonella australis AUST/NH1]|uniref:Transglycosylase SLT domain-containing protein n=1 Tax=Bartonella australis (strain Aust/NH1) TaxID=1094489 RepID=M1P4E2_BARAA|nr:transglycosylase SLT domain-containing protein [Bartonella australis]AGF74725.1 hypothetical protein BAnh1_08490 [Bartonella australis AUST/NH1]
MRFLKIFLSTAFAVSFLFGVNKTHAVLVASAPTKSLAAVFSGGSVRPYEALIKKIANKYKVPVSLAHAVISVESNYKARAKGSAGEIGLMQIKPSTARGLGFSGPVRDLYNPAINLEYGMRYLAQARQLSGGNTCRTILKYNAGHAAKKMNPISARYCEKVKMYLASLKR